MNTIEIDQVLKTHPSTRSVFKGVYARNRLPRRLNVPSAWIGNTDSDDRLGTHWIALYIDAYSRGEYYNPQEDHPFQGLTWTLWINIVRVGLTTPSEFKKKVPLYANTTVYFIWYTDVPEYPWAMLREHWDTREKPVIVKTFVHRLINNA